MSTQYNQSVSGSVRLLQEVLSHPEPVGSRELAKLLGEEHTRVSRMLGTLHSEGFLCKTEKRKYSPGPGIHVLTALALRNSPLLRLALPELKKLKSPRRAVALGVLWKDKVCFMVHSRPKQTLEEGIGTHKLHPARESSLGLALLADALKEDPSPEFARIRSEGFARLDFPDGAVSLALNVGSPAMAAIGASVGKPSEEELAETFSLLKGAKAEIERLLAAEAASSFIV